MQIDKSQIMDLLKSRGDEKQISQADSELPESLDTEKDAGLLAKFGIGPQDLIGKLGSLGGLTG